MKPANPVDAAIGARVKIRRKELGMSQEDLGNALDLTFQQVQKYEKGTNRIGGSRMVQIAATLKTTPAYFYGSGEPEADEIAMLMAHQHAGPMLHAFVKLPVHLRLLSLQMVQSLVEAHQ